MLALLKRMNLKFAHIVELLVTHSSSGLTQKYKLYVPTGCYPTDCMIYGFRVDKYGARDVTRSSGRLLQVLS